MRLRSGVISSRSLGQSFEDWWTSSLEATHASHSQQQDSDKEKTTQGTCGPISQMEFDLCAQDSASLRMSKGTSRWDSPQSSVIWKNWVTECRGEYLARLKLARLTSENESSSWPTVSARDWKGCYQTLERKDGKFRGDLLPDAVRIVESGGKCHSLATATKMGTAQSVDSTTQTADVQDLLRMDLNTESMKISCSLPTPCANEDSFRLNGSSQQSKTLEAMARRGELKTAGSACIVDRMSFQAAHATTMNLDVISAESGHTHSTTASKMDAHIVEVSSQDGMTYQPGPLNPQFVEVMMGLPIGWTDCDS